jgi:hypothetical protein
LRLADAGRMVRDGNPGSRPPQPTGRACKPPVPSGGFTFVALSSGLGAHVRSRTGST